jgi:hypothetical protein
VWVVPGGWRGRNAQAAPLLGTSAYAFLPGANLGWTTVH